LKLRIEAGAISIAFTKEEEREREREREREGEREREIVRKRKRKRKRKRDCERKQIESDGKMSFRYLERAHERIIHAHHGPCIVELPTVVGCAKDGD
jgi:hypothetical protein